MERKIDVPQFNLSDLSLPKLDPSQLKSDLVAAHKAIKAGAADLFKTWAVQGKADNDVHIVDVMSRIDQDALYIRTGIALAVAALSTSRSTSELRPVIEEQLKNLDRTLISFNRNVPHRDPDFNGAIDLTDFPDSYPSFLKTEVSKLKQPIKELLGNLVSFSSGLNDRGLPAVDTRFIVPKRAKLERDRSEDSSWGDNFFTYG